MTAEVRQHCYDFGQRDFDLQETLSLLKRYGFRFWSWGASGFTNIRNNVLVFKVNGHHHKGYVLISLGWEDLYRVKLVSTHGNVKFEMDGIFFDQLFDILDERIEKIPEYKV